MQCVLSTLTTWGGTGIRHQASHHHSFHSLYNLPFHFSIHETLSSSVCGYIRTSHQTPHKARMVSSRRTSSAAGCTDHIPNLPSVHYDHSCLDSPRSHELPYPSERRFALESEIAQVSGLTEERPSKQCRRNPAPHPHPGRLRRPVGPEVGIVEAFADVVEAVGVAGTSGRTLAY